ncbi:MAG: HNH endonuclease signature motif containing protein, partial [Nocardioides sp.]|nr:HNH endonuclease signature motif containing protein [Nocardioides sp.]
SRPGGIARDGITLRPVLETARTDGVDGRLPPEWMREQVVLRDRTCVFPDCTRDARSSDLDHIEPYVEGGPPGQTTPANLAALCRRHHRLKTWTGWTYRRDGWDTDGRPLYEWLDRHGNPALPRHLLEPAES